MSCLMLRVCTHLFCRYFNVICLTISNLSGILDTTDTSFVHPCGPPTPHRVDLVGICVKFQLPSLSRSCRKVKAHNKAQLDVHPYPTKLQGTVVMPAAGSRIVEL